MKPYHNIISVCLLFLAGCSSRGPYPPELGSMEYTPEDRVILEKVLEHFEDEVMAHMEQGGCPFNEKGGA